MKDVQRIVDDPLQTDPIIVFTLMEDEDFDENTPENSALSRKAPAHALLATQNRNKEDKPYQVAVRYGALLRLMPLPFWNAIKNALMTRPEFKVTDR